MVHFCVEALRALGWALVGVNEEQLLNAACALAGLGICWVYRKMGWG